MGLPVLDGVEAVLKQANVKRCVLNGEKAKQTRKREASRNVNTRVQNKMPAKSGQNLIMFCIPIMIKMQNL